MYERFYDLCSSFFTTIDQGELLTFFSVAGRRVGRDVSAEDKKDSSKNMSCSLLF